MTVLLVRFGVCSAGSSYLRMRVALRRQLGVHLGLSQPDGPSAEVGGLQRRRILLAYGCRRATVSWEYIRGCRSVTVLLVRFGVCSAGSSYLCLPVAARRRLGFFGFVRDARGSLQRWADSFELAARAYTLVHHCLPAARDVVRGSLQRRVGSVGLAARTYSPVRRVHFCLPAAQRWIMKREPVRFHWIFTFLQRGMCVAPCRAALDYLGSQRMSLRLYTDGSCLPAARNVRGYLQHRLWFI